MKHTDEQIDEKRDSHVESVMEFLLVAGLSPDSTGTVRAALATAWTNGYWSGRIDGCVQGYQKAVAVYQDALSPKTAGEEKLDERPLLAEKLRKPCPVCGAVEERLPHNAKYHDDGSPLSGHYWDCRCGSTRFAPLKIKG